MRTVVGGLVLVGMLALSGCVESTPLPTLPPTSTTAPIFASEEEALAAAEAAYAAYLEVSNQIANDGGADPERIAPFVTGDRLPDELASSRRYADNDLHSVGAVELTGVALQQYLEVSGKAEVVTYVCLDVAGARLVDGAGVDVTPSERAPEVTLEVTFRSDASGVLLISDSELWANSYSCS